MKNKLILFSLIFALVACGGGSGGSDNTTVFQGTLVQGPEATARLAHEAGEKIEGVQICALGTCSTTDGNGQWGFGLETPPSAIEFSAIGHGINSSWVIEIPATAKDVTIELENHPEGVHAHSVLADGVEVLDTHHHD